MQTQFALADDEGLEFFHEVFAVIGVNFQGDGLGEVEREDAEDGLSIDDVAADAKVDVVGVAVGNVDEGLNVFSKAELDVDSFHGPCPSLTSHDVRASACIYSILLKDVTFKRFWKVYQHLIRAGHSAQKC